MALHTYLCASGHTQDVLLPKESEPTLCYCGRPMQRRSVYALRIVGPIHIDMDRYNLSHFSLAELRAGKGFKDAADLRRWQVENGVEETDGFSRTFDTVLDEAQDEVNTIERVHREGGAEGVAAWEREEEVRSAVPEWSKAEYVHWRNHTDDAQSTVDAAASVAATRLRDEHVYTRSTPDNPLGDAGPLGAHSGDGSAGDAGDVGR